jgi:hypothetical protein
VRSTEERRFIETNYNKIYANKGNIWSSEKIVHFMHIGRRKTPLYIHGVKKEGYRLLGAMIFIEMGKNVPVKIYPGTIAC